MRKLKNLFATPRKAVLSCLIAVVFLLTVCTGTVLAAEAMAESSAIGAENAQNFAFADAGVDPVSAQIIRTEFDFEMGQFVYEVEFTASGIAYEYWLKASNGTVLKKEVEILRLDGSSVTATAKITMDQAKEIALTDAGVSITQVIFAKAELDVEDGISLYEIEFHVENIAYAYEIYAETGEIYSKSKETVIMQPTPSVPENPVETKPPQNPQSPQETKPDSYIGLDEAKQAALQDAGVAAADVTFTKAKLEKEDGTAVYDIEFYTATHEYEYDIHAVTGAVLDKSVEARKTAPPNTDPQPDSYIGLDAAKQAALQDAGVTAADATFTKAKLEKEDGTAVYDIEFYTATHEYEYDIHAVTGAVLDKSVEARKTAPPNTDPKPDGYIGLDEAKRIAVERAGLSVSQVTFKKAKLDKDDGVVVYEIAFFYNGMEYECEINATTGEILDYECERDD